MKRPRRLALVLVPIVLLAAGVWFYGRAPSQYVLEQCCRDFHEERRGKENLLRYEISRLESALAPGEDPGPALIDLRQTREAARRAIQYLEIRGWEVVLIPAGAPRPDPSDFLVAGRFDSAEANDPAPLRGGIEVWIAPRGALARFVYALGLD